jgi:hypothetical protein
MSFKINKLENQSNLRNELRDIFKTFGSGVRKNKENDKKIRMSENKNEPANDIDMIDSSNTLHEKVNIEIDVAQRTTVFSNDVSMWI